MISRNHASDNVSRNKEDEVEESYYPLPLRQQEDAHQSTTGRCSTGTPVETPRRHPAWWIQFLQFMTKLIWCVLWNVVGNPLQLLIGRVVSILQLLPTTIVAKLTKAERTTMDSDDDHRRGMMMVPSAKETTIATSSPSSSSARRTSNELLSSGSTTSANNKDTIDAKHCHPVVVLYDDDDDDDDASHYSNIDAFLAREMQTKLVVAPIQSIIVTFIKTIDNHCTTDDGGSNHHNDDQNRHRPVRHHHLFDHDDWSVLTMDPTLQAISRRLAEGLIPYPHQPHRGLSAMMVVGPGSGDVDDDDDDDDDAVVADDLSEIAPLDLVSL
jgi:hypothetical protein